MKISEVINAAYRKIGVVGHGMSATAEQSSAGIEAFNLMLSAWTLDGIDAWMVPGQNPFAQVSDHQATEDFPMPPAFTEGAVYCLAARLAPEFSMQTGFSEEAFLSKMRAAFVEMPTLTIDQSILKPASNPRWWFS
jgi:hypothetical protein